MPEVTDVEGLVLESASHQRCNSVRWKRMRFGSPVWSITKRSGAMPEGSGCTLLRRAGLFPR